MIVLAGSTDVTTYFHLRLAASGLDATGLTIANVDMQYTRSGVAPTAKVDAQALAATDTAHTDNFGIEIDATDQPGLYRFDWPDAAFAAGVREVLLTIKVATAFTETLRVAIVGYDPSAALATPTNITAGTLTTVTNLTNLPAITANWLTATGIQADAITAAKVAADVGTEIGTAVWATATRVLTAATNLTTALATPTNITGGTITTVTTVTSAGLSAAAVDAILDEVVEGTTTLRQALRGYSSALLSKASGLATTTAVYRDIGDTKDRITATVDADGNRSAVTTDLT